MNVFLFWVENLEEGVAFERGDMHSKPDIVMEQLNREGLVLWYGHVLVV